MDYSKGKIYKITDIGYNECYYGSTIQPLSKRIGKHRSDYKRYKDGKCNNVTSFILFDKYGVENCKIELVEDCDCKTKEELHKREGFYIRNNECVNKVITGRTWKEYYKDCLEVITFEITKWGLRNIKIKRSNKRRQEKRPKEYVNVNKFYVLDCIGLSGYFVRNTARGFKYSSYYSSAKKFLDEKQAKKFHEKLRNKDRFEVKYIYLGEYQTIRL